VDDAQAVKTLAHDLLTAPIGPSGTGGGGGCSDDTPRGSRLGLSWRVLCWAHDHRSTGEGIVADWLELGSGPRDVKRLAVPVVGAVVAIDEVPGTALLDASGRPVVVVADFFRGMLASGASVSSLRSYGLALLRWWRFLAAVEVPWDRAGRVEAQDFVLWMRMVGPAGRPGGYAPATINHGLAVVKAFYADRIAAGQGPLVNPIPEAVHRDGRRVQAHHNPMQPFAPGPRAPLRQRVPERVPRSIPDGLFDALFATVRSDRDRALLAFWVSTGARAAELLGASLDRIEPGEQRIGVHRKGSRRLQWLPASADAFVWWRLYEARVARPSGERALWLTNRSPVRPLTYPAARRMLQRANDALGTRWTLHDLRHTAAQRMIDDPHLSLTDVQWVLGHAHLTTTQLYLRARPDEVIAKVLEHHRTRAERPPAPLVPPGADGYPADVLEVLLGGGRRG
ncbi:MAG TPA: tyrosine-type recombinase/integrase, partial [Propionibacteriaceae bacterium]|nr:tyrosine-type recombinase/integrase [Propionibacteriaceae bacterium]